MPIVPADSNSFVLPSTSELTLLLGPRHSDSKQENKKKPFHQPNRSCLAFERERARGSARHRRAAHVFKTKHSSSRCFCGSDAAPPPSPTSKQHQMNFAPFHITARHIAVSEAPPTACYCLCCRRFRCERAAAVRRASSPCRARDVHSSAPRNALRTHHLPIPLLRAAGNRCNRHVRVSTQRGPIGVDY